MNLRGFASTWLQAAGKSTDAGNLGHDMALLAIPHRLL
jgi:hypothetical protein